MVDLVLSTFNLRNLQLPGLFRFPGAVPYEHAFYRRKVRWIGEAIRLIGPDVMGVEELFAGPALVEALDHVNLDDDYHVVSRPADETGRQQNALLVHRRHSVVEHEYIADLPEDLILRKRDRDETSIAVDTDQFARPVLRVVVDLDVGTRPVRVTFLVAHLKSKRPMNLDADVLARPTFLPPDREALGSALATIKRTAEAAGLRILISRVQSAISDDDAGMPVVVLGDLNTSANSTELDIITTHPRYRLEHGTTIGSSSRWGLYSVATLQQLRSLDDVYLTYLHDGFYDSLDHILATQHFYDHSDARIWSFREANVFNDHLPFAGLGRDHEMHVTDHGIVRAVFEYNPAR